MNKKVIQFADSFEEADALDFKYYQSLSCEQRIQIALELMAKAYEAYPRFERIYRVVDQALCPVLDSWRLGD